MRLSKVAVLMKLFASRLMRVYPVSSAVGNVKNDGPECAEEIKNPEEEAQQHRLF
jgi:putative SOS response-associated peptidase YedK